MKLRKLLLFPLPGLLVLTSLFSCGEDRWKEYYPLTGRDLWMDSLMREVYLWYEDIPASKGLNYFQGPEAFLKSILSKNDKGFSTVDTIMDTPLPSYGFDYTLYKIATSDTTYNALVSYVAKNSPAEEAGLERGSWIMLVDGDSITKKTEERLMDGGARTLHIGKYVIVKDENNEDTEGDTETEDGDSEDTEDDEDDKGVGVIQEIGDVTLPAVRPVTESPVYVNGVIALEGTDYKIAYLAYNSFTAGTAESNEKYNNELRTFSQQCKQLNINNFILDLRYNSGGEMECVQLLADILVPADRLESPFAFLQYNDTFINPKYPWALRPVVCEVFNSNGEANYSTGFKPDISINETSYLQYYLPLGDPNEILLNTALGVIAGAIELPKSQTTETAVKSFTTKKNIRKGFIIK